MKMNLTDEQENALREHVAYEHNMLKFTKEALVKCFSDPKLACNTLAFDTCSRPPVPDLKQKELQNALDALLDNSSKNWENLRNALLESFLIHLRNLYDFYYKKKDKRSDDLVAGCFFREWDISSAIPNSVLLKEIKQRINKHLSHLTWERVKNPEPKWDVKQVAPFAPMEEAIEKGKAIFSEKLRNEFNTVPKFWDNP